MEVQLVQVAHAAGESILREIQGEATSCIVLHLPDEQTLYMWSEILWMKGLFHRKIFEPDKPWNGQLMSIGVCPRVDTPELRKIFKYLPLARFGKEVEKDV